MRFDVIFSSAYLLEPAYFWRSRASHGTQKLVLQNADHKMHFGMPALANDMKSWPSWKVEIVCQIVVPCLMCQPSTHTYVMSATQYTDLSATSMLIYTDT